MSVPPNLCCDKTTPDTKNICNFPDSPVVKTPHFYRRSLIPGQGTKIPHTERHSKRNTKLLRFSSYQKNNRERVRTQTTNLEKISTAHIISKGLIPRICKEFLLVEKKNKPPSFKQAKT